MRRVGVGVGTGDGVRPVGVGVGTGVRPVGVGVGTAAGGRRLGPGDRDVAESRPVRTGCPGPDASARPVPLATRTAAGSPSHVTARRRVIFILASSSAPAGMAGGLGIYRRDGRPVARQARKKE